MADRKPTLSYATPGRRPPEPLWLHIGIYLGITSAGAVLIWGLFSGLSDLIQ